MPFKSSKARAAFFVNKRKKEKEDQLKEALKPKLPEISKTEIEKDSKELDEYIKPLTNPLDKFKKLKNLLKPKF